MSFHLTPQTIENIIAGQVCPEEERRFYRHWRTCPVCQSAIKDRITTTGFHKLPPPENIRGEIIIIDKDPGFYVFTNNTAVVAASFSLSGLKNIISPVAEKISIAQNNNSGSDIRDQIVAYFSGQPLRRIQVRSFFIKTEFERNVLFWTWLVPYGCVTTYGEIATWIGNRNAARGVGGALHRNPLPVFIPCHRVVGTKGHLTGFRGGITIKKQLLLLEGRKIIKNRVRF